MTPVSVEKGELAVILGCIGSRKTTALNILGGMDSATEGEVIVDGRHVNEYKAKDLSHTDAMTWALYFSSITLFQT